MAGSLAAEARDVIKTALIDFGCSTSQGAGPRATAIIARLAGHEPPLLICHPDELRDEKDKLAQAALEIMTRRWWRPKRIQEGWTIESPFPNLSAFDLFLECFNRPDPFTALVDADKWYRQNIEGKHAKVS